MYTRFFFTCIDKGIWAISAHIKIHTTLSITILKILVRNDITIYVFHLNQKCIFNSP